MSDYSNIAEHFDNHIKSSNKIPKKYFARKTGTKKIILKKNKYIKDKNIVKYVDKKMKNRDLPNIYSVLEENITESELNDNGNQGIDDNTIDIESSNDINCENSNSDYDSDHDDYGYEREISDRYDDYFDGLSRFERNIGDYMSYSEFKNSRFGF